MQANSIICSGTSRFLNDTYTTNLHTNKIDVTTGSNYLSSLTPYVWSIYSKQEEPLLFLTQTDSNGNITDQLYIKKDDIYIRATWDGTNSSLKRALGAKFNSAGGTISGAVSMSNNLTVSGSGSFNIGTVRINSGAINFYRNPSQDVMTSAIQDTANGLEIMIPTSRSTNIRVISSTGYINLLTKYGVGVYNEVGDGYKGITASNFTTASSRVVKKNIKDITVADAKKILDLRPCTFDFKIGNEKNCAGMIAEEVMDVYPHLVSVPDDYDEEEAIEKTAKGELAQVPSLDYSKFVPYLIKMIQEQQKEIDELRERLTP